MGTRAAAGAIGMVFGATLSWSGMANPEVLRAGLLLEDSYLYLFFASALATSFVGLRLLRRSAPRSVLTHEPLSFATVRPQRNHVVGSVMFGVGWGVANVCPGPIATQLGQGIPWALAIGAGLVLGVWLFLNPGRQLRALRPTR